ncbi:uncharacterized protein LOC112569933 isoform X2 [Pomacea canaliculata]|nr:uncharacterized protein LOC112569933 isoform X2 [Pomacea canaliculata]
MLHKSGLTLHYFCMLFSSGLCQRGKREEDGILGFLPADIRRERKRGMRLSCQYCRRKGATIGCVVTNCRKTFHFPCGRDAGAMCQFFDEFRSYCPEHRPRQSAGSGASDRLAFYGTALSTCSICIMAVEARASNGTIRSPCCKSAWFHRDCMQKYAISAGRYFFKCPLCNNKELFQAEMLQFGIYVPDQDAAWEREPNAYQELLERYSCCDAPKCVCPQGRQHDGMAGGRWELILCSWCGSSGSHMGCNGFTRIRKDNVCNFCAKINNSKLMERKHLNHQQSNNIARRRGRPARRGRGRGRGGRVAISSGNRCTSPRESRLKLLDVDVVLHRVDEDQLLQSVQISSYGDEDVNVEDFDDNLNLTKESCFSEEQDVDKSNFDAANDDDTDYCQLVRKSEGGENPECRGGTCSVIPSLPCVTFGSGDTHEGPRQTTSMPQGKRRVGRPRKHPPVGGESSSASPSVPHLTFGSENAGKTPAQQVKRCVGRPRKHSPELCEQNIAHLSVPSTTCDRADKELSPSLCSTDQVHFESSGATNHSHTLSDLSKGKVLCSGKRANQGRKPRPYNKQKEVDWCLENKLSSFDIKSAPADDPCSSTANDITDAACHTTTDLLDIAERHASYQQFIASKSPSQDISAQPIKTLFLPVPQSESSLSFQSADSEQTSSFGLVDFSSGNLKPTQNTHLTSSPDFCTPPASGFAVSSVLGTHQTAYSCMTKPENSVNSTCLNKHETLAGSSWPLSSSLQTSYQVESFPVSSQTSFSSQAVNFASSSQLVTPELQCFSSTLSKPSCSLASGLFETPHNLMTLTTAPVVSSMASEMVESSETSMEDVWENNSPQVAWSAVADRPVPVSLFAHGCPPIPSNPLTSVSQSELQTVTSSLSRSRPYMASNIYTPVSSHAETKSLLPMSRGKIWLGSVQVINQLSKNHPMLLL